MEILISLFIAYLLYKWLSSQGRKSDANSVFTKESLSFSSSGNSKSKSRNRTPGIWMQPSETVTVGKHELSGGLIYVGGRLSGYDDYGSEAALIDPTLKVAHRNPDRAGTGMGYWPSYHGITPSSRAAYLEWLADGRCEPNTYIGFVFLYFYGLERRILIDLPAGNVSTDESDILSTEIDRLISLYGDNRSFHSYATRLRSFHWVLRGGQGDNDGFINEKSYEFDSTFLYALACLVEKGLPITPAMALLWIKQHPDYRLRTPARRCSFEFDQLFKLRYESKFGDGILVKPNKTSLVITYRPASPSLSGYPPYKPGLPDPSRLTGPARKLNALAEDCTDALDSYSRFIGRPQNSRDTLGGLSLLPAELASIINNPALSKLRVLCQQHIDEKQATISLGTLFSEILDSQPDKVSKRDCEKVASTLELAGYGMAPDVRFHHAKPSIDDPVILFRQESSQGVQGSKEFNSALTILRLGAMVAIADGIVADAETELLQDYVLDSEKLEANDKLSLLAYLQWRLVAPADSKGLKAQVAALNDSQKQSVRKVLISVARADERLDVSEVRHLEKLYTNLGFDRKLVSSDLHEFAPGNLPATTGRNTSGGPLDSSSSEGGPSKRAFSLDHDLLKSQEAETASVQEMLSSIFVSDVEDIEPDNASLAQAPLAKTSEGQPTQQLHEGYHTLYSEIISQDTWSREVLEARCDALNVLMDGALEIINDWSFECVDAPLLEGDDPIYVDLDIVTEIDELGLNPKDSKG